MPANFENVRLKYDFEGTAELFELWLNIDAINFDINQASIGPLMPFTSELSFEINVANHENAKYSNLKELSNQIIANVRTQSITEVTEFTNLDPIPAISTLFKDYIFREEHVILEYFDVEGEVPSDSNPTNIQLPKSKNIQTLVSLISPESSEDLFSLKWRVKIKFPSKSPLESNEIYNQSLVLYPELELGSLEILDPNNSTNIIGKANLLAYDNSLSKLNDNLRLFYELLYLPSEIDSGSNVPGAIGKASDDLADTISDLRNSIASGLAAPVRTQLQTPGNNVSYDLALWALIKMNTEQLRFRNYEKFMEEVLCGKNHNLTKRERDTMETLNQTRSLPFMNVDAYRFVKIATEAFVMVNCAADIRFTQEELDYLRDNVPLVNGVFDQNELERWWNEYRSDTDGNLPYLAAIQSKLKDQEIRNTPFANAFNNYLNPESDLEVSECYGILSHKLTHPCFIELIWSYWHEECMMVQGMNAITRRFQNVKGPGKVDPLANMEIDPLRPLSNLLWGYLQDENNRLTVRRRAYEYNHHYGISLKGTATKNMRFADSRSKFIEAFHRLLNMTSRFYKQADDMTVKPDGFPILNALREVHLVLSEGAHNQYGDMPSVARAEMLMQQWMFAQPQFREVLPTRVMVAFPETWMDRVSALNNLMGWTNTNVLHFNRLGFFGEQLLLSIRFGHWADINERGAASNWANFWREQIQGYIHSYHTVTGIDLSADSRSNTIDAQQPSVHLHQRLKEQNRTRQTA